MGGGGSVCPGVGEHAVDSWSAGLINVASFLDCQRSFKNLACFHGERLVAAIAAFHPKIDGYQRILFPDLQRCCVRRRTLRGPDLGGQPRGACLWVWVRCAMVARCLWRQPSSARSLTSGIFCSPDVGEPGQRVMCPVSQAPGFAAGGSKTRVCPDP